MGLKSTNSLKSSLSRNLTDNIAGVCRGEGARGSELSKSHDERREDIFFNKMRELGDIIRPSPAINHVDRELTASLRGALGSFLCGNGLLFAHGADDGHQEVFTFIEIALDLFAQISLGEPNVVLGSAVLSHEVEKAVINVDKGVFTSGDIGNIHVMGGRTNIFQFLASKDIDSDEMDLGMAMLSRLGRGHFHNLARTTFYDDVTIFTESRTLNGIGSRRAGTRLLKRLVVALILRHDGSI